MPKLQEEKKQISSQHIQDGPFLSQLLLLSNYVVNTFLRDFSVSSNKDGRSIM